MEQNLMITDIVQIFEGEFNPGNFPGPKHRNHDGLVYYLEGKAIYKFDGYSLEVDPGCFFFLAKGSHYTIEIQEKSKYICADIHFTENPQIRKSCVFSPVPPSIREDFIALLHEWNQNRPRRIPYCLGIIYTLYAQAITAENDQDGRKEHLFLQASTYFLKHYPDFSLSVQETAAHVGISEVHLRRIFRDVAHVTPVRYLMDLRLEQAKILLQSSNYSIFEIALAVGFSDQYYFSRLFKKSNGQTPSEYREKHH